MDSTNGSENEHIDVVTPPTVTKKSRTALPKAATPKAIPAGDGDADKDAGNFSKTEMMLLIEMITTLGESANGIKFNWAAVSEKLGLPSAGATAKRAERLLKRFDLKMSDITGGNKGRTPKKADGEATTPASKRKTGNTDEDGLETPTKRRGKAKPAAKKGAVKKEAEDSDGDVFL